MSDRLVILVRDDITMSRGKRCAQAVHAALLALGAHPGCPVVVLGASKAEVEACSIQVNDAGVTELEPGTLTAGVREVPAQSRAALDVYADVAEVRHALSGGEHR